MIPLTGFAPDLDPTTPGVILDCSNIVPTINGMAGAPTPEDATLGGSAVPAISVSGGGPIGAATLERLDGIRRVLVGTGAYILELCPASSGSGFYPSGSAGWRIVGGIYSSIGGGSGIAGSYPRWRFCAMGNTAIAAAPGTRIQASGSYASTFADIDAAAPQARIVESTAGFVLAFSTKDGASAEVEDGWWCSALYDPTDWTPSAATQSANGRLLDTPGEIRGAKRLGDGIVAYKAHSMYVGAYVGPPIIWAWSLVSGEIGAVSHEAIISTGYAHYFMSANDFWVFDGTRPQSIGGNIRLWWQANHNPTLLHKSQAHYDKDKAIIRWWYVSATGTDLDACLTYHIPTGKWGQEDAPIGLLAVLDYIEPYDSYSSANDYTSYPAIVDSGGNLSTLTGANVSSNIQLGLYGDDDVVSLLRRIRFRFSAGKAPTSGLATIQSAANLGDSLTSRGSLLTGTNKVDMLYSDRWFKPFFEFTGPHELLAVDLDLVPVGKR